MRISITRIADSPTPHPECQHQREVVASLHRSKAAIAFVTIIVMSTTVMLVIATIGKVLSRRFITDSIMMMTVRAVVGRFSRSHNCLP